MKRSGVLLALAGITALSCGCGTMFNMLYFTPIEGGMSVYGGVRLDGYLVKECVTGENGHNGQDIGKRALYTAAAVLDMPFSAVADTLALPIALSAKPGSDSPEPQRKPTQ